MSPLPTAEPAGRTGTRWVWVRVPVDTGRRPCWLRVRVTTGPLREPDRRQPRPIGLPLGARASIGVVRRSGAPAEPRVVRGASCLR